jgi:hypothetical protein
MLLFPWVLAGIEESNETLNMSATYLNEKHIILIMFIRRV